MRFILVLVGAVCLIGTTHAQSGYITDIVSKAIGISKTNLTAAIQQVNITINMADQTILTSWNQYVKSMVDLYTSYYNRFKNYTTIDLTSITGAISNLQNSRNNPPPMTMQDSSVAQLFATVQGSALQVENALNDAAINMTIASGAACYNPYVGTCAKKYGTMLTVAPLTIDRVRDCIVAERTRYTNIGSNVTLQYTNLLTSAMNYLMVVNVCDTPAPAVLNNPSTNYGPPSTQCLTNYLQRISSIPSGYMTDSIRYTQMEMVSFRMRRCAKLVQVDIQDRINKVLTDFYTCLKTGV